MQVIIIEDTVYKVSDSVYKKLQQSYEDCQEKRRNIWSPETADFQEADKMEQIIESLRPKFKEIGIVMFNYRH